MREKKGRSGMAAGAVLCLLSLALCVLYQRAGYGASSTSMLERTPENIAGELHQLLQRVGHDRTITLLAHSQGGLYAWKFAKMYPELVDKLILLDPLSPEDYRFRTELTETEFRKSGADKTAGLRLNLRLTKLHLGWLVQKTMRTAPPFYYYNGFSDEEADSILSGLGKPLTYQTALAEYAAAHDRKKLAGLLDRGCGQNPGLNSRPPKILCNRQEMTV